MRLASPELLERIAQDQKAKRTKTTFPEKKSQKKEGFIREKSVWDVKKKHLRKLLRIKLFVHSLLRVGMSEELIAYYTNGPRSLVHNIVKGWKRTEFLKILQERAKEDERRRA